MPLEKVQAKKTLTKLETFLKEFAPPPVHIQNSPKNLDKKLDINQSPVAATVNVFENEHSIINILNQTGSTTGKSSDYIMGDFQNKRKASKSFTTKHKRKVTSKLSSKLVRSKTSNTLVSSPESKVRGRKCWISYCRKSQSINNNSTNENISTNTIESISIVSDYSDRKTVSSNYEIVDISDEEPITEWERINWMFGTENKPVLKETNNKSRRIESSEDSTYSSPLCKGLDFIREYSKEYVAKAEKIKRGYSEKRRKTSSCTSKSKTTEQSRCPKLQSCQNNNHSCKSKKSLSKSCTRRDMSRDRSVSEKSFTNTSSCNIVKSTHKTQISQKTYSRISKTNTYNGGKTTITDYFSKKKVSHENRENCNDLPQTVCNVFDKDYILSLDSKERVKQFNINENNEHIVKNETFVQKAKPLRNVNDTLTKTQKKLFSSEGFFESLSSESPIQNSNKNKKTYTIPDATKEKDSPKVYQSSLKDFFTPICYNSIETLPETNIALKNKREQSSEYYVMKITGRESKALIDKILNNDENTQVSSISFKKKNENFRESNTDLNVGTETLLKNTLSDHLSFGSPILSYSGNAKQNIDGDAKKNTEGKAKLGTELTQSMFAKNTQALMCNSPSFYKEPLVTDMSTTSRPSSSQLAQTKKDNGFKEHLQKHHGSNNWSSQSGVNKQNSKNSQEFTLSQSTSQHFQKCVKSFNDIDLSQMQCKTVNSSALKSSGNSQDILDKLNRHSRISPISNNLKDNSLQNLHESNRWSSQRLTNKPNLKNSPEFTLPQNYQKSVNPSRNTDNTANVSGLKSSGNNQDILDQQNKNSTISPTAEKISHLKENSQNFIESDNHSQPQPKTENSFFEKILTQNFLNIFNEKCEEHTDYTEQSIRKDTADIENIKETENTRNNESHNNEYFEIEATGECYSQTNFEYFKKFANAQPESMLTESEVPSQVLNKKLRKTYNITKDCILHEDNLLKSLLETKQDARKNLKKTVLKRKNSEALVDNCTKAYIKRFKKGNTKIYQIRKRKKLNDKEDFKPPEGKIMDKFLEKATNDFLDETRSDLIEHRDDSSVSTPTSYITDDTKSECLSTGSSKLAEPQRLLRRGINKLSKDKSLHFVPSIDTPPKEFDKNEILENIDRILSNVLEDFNQGRAAFKIPKEHITNCVFRDQRFQIKDSPEYTTVSYKATASRPKFNLILFVLNKIKMLLESDTKLTKREIYYQLKTMINSQSTTDQALKDVSRLLNVGLWALNVIAQKGLVYGNLKLVMADGETINCNVPGTLIPQDISKICEVHSTSYFILVVEKESIFHKLLEENLPNRLTRPFILITGKGFPDLNTQLFLKKLWMIMSIPVFILVDADPDGIAIMLNYRFGSIANAHVSEHLAIPKARWVGVFPSEILKLSFSYENLSKREISKTQTLLQLPCVHENEKIKLQLEKLLENGVKTGIEGLVKTDTYLSNFYLNFKFYTNNLI